MTVTTLSDQNLKASVAEPHFENRSSKPAARLSAPSAITSFVSVSSTINSAPVSPLPAHPPVVPFLTRLMPSPTGTTEVTALTPGLLVLSFLEGVALGPTPEQSFLLDFAMAPIYTR